jgi:hypothetical protein
MVSNGRRSRSANYSFERMYPMLSSSLACTKLNTKFNSYSSFHVVVSEDDFHLINNATV